MFSSNASQVSAANYIEDVFSTYLYDGNSSTQTITNGIDLSTKGGLVWIKNRNYIYDHGLFDTARGVGKGLRSNLTNAQFDLPTTTLTAFNSNGFSLGDNVTYNESARTYTSWTFRKQAKFFDVVTYTGDDTAGRQISHGLGSVPGCIIIKCTSNATDWAVYHRSIGNAYQLTLNVTNAQGGSLAWNYTDPTSTVFTVGSSTTINGSGRTYVAYLFAHDAGGFGASGSDNVISCGSYTGTGAAGNFVSLGYEPQWLLIKRSDASQDWFLFDNMRGLVTGTGGDLYLNPNLSGAEGASGTYVAANATGFTLEGATTGFNASGGTYIYIAIRRGPMKTPTSGTSVFSAKPYVATSTSAEVTHDVTFDVEINANRTSSVAKFLFVDSLRGINGTVVYTSTTGPENSYPTYWSRKSQRTMYAPSAFDDWWAATSTNQNHISYGLVRAPGFFDEVCYTGTGASATLNHNLGVAPNMVIIKGRSVVSNWETYLSSLGGTSGNGLALNDPGAKTGTPPVSSATATTFTLNNGVSTSSGQTYVAYLFATLTGVSKVGSYSGTGALQTINCGFSAGARFVLIKRTDSTGDWYVWDSARGISSGNDPYLLLNSTAAEVTGTNYVDTTSVGFQVTAAAPAALNASGGTYIFLAIA